MQHLPVLHFFFLKTLKLPIVSSKLSGWLVRTGQFFTMIFQAMAQVGGIVMLQPEVGGSRENFFFAGIDKVRFRKPVIAGDTLIMRMTLIKLQKRFGIAKMEGKAYVGADLVCEGEFLMATGSEWMQETHGLMNT
jgi:hypothetical protein